jgi:hypothetical protein
MLTETYEADLEYRFDQSGIIGRREPEGVEGADSSTLTTAFSEGEPMETRKPEESEGGKGRGGC